MLVVPMRLLCRCNTRHFSSIFSFIGFLAAALLLSGCGPVTHEQPTVSISEWFDARYEEEIQFSPISLTYMGRKDRNNELDDNSYEAFKTHLAWKQQTVTDLNRLFDYESLSNEEQTSFDIWTYQYERMRKAEAFFYSGLTFDQMNGDQSQLPTFLINIHRVDNLADMEAYIARIKAVAPYMTTALNNAKRTSALGITTPGFALDGVIQQSKAIISGAPFGASEDGVAPHEDSPIWADIKHEINALLDNSLINAEQADQLLTNARLALLQDFQPVYESVIDWAEAEQDKVPARSTGVGSQPNGAAYYEYRLASQTTTNLSAEEIHNIGLAEVARLRDEMALIVTEVNFEGDLDSFMDSVRGGDWNYYPNTDAGRQAYIDDASTAINALKQQIPVFFGLLPKADLVVKRVESFRERDGAAQHYFRGTPDGTRPGVYYAHLSDMTTMPKSLLEVVAYHEGIPGHHMQISIAQELQGLPLFRTRAGFTAYSEGWGLYAEVLAKEMPATYLSPYSRFGQLTSEIWRAIRLVVDTGLHARGWTEQEAIDYFLANSPQPLENVRSEIQRYIIMPGQATSYKIGMLKIQSLRAKAELALGDQFDIRAFHDTVLGGGALPLPLLERRVDRWIGSVLKQA
jgi:uncharacterized protein (DUF885 family)